MTAEVRFPSPRFDGDDAGQAYLDWGANCGPGAIAAVSGMTLSEVRFYMGDFEQKRYTNPSLMFDTLDRLVEAKRLRSYQRHRDRGAGITWPAYGLARIQWCGPWTAPGVPERAAYRHTHWVAAAAPPRDVTVIFDINSAEAGWVPLRWWSATLVPWLLSEADPKASGEWFLTHSIEVAL